MSLTPGVPRAPRHVHDQVTDAYRRMAAEARYRPAAPSDGLGNITVALDRLDLDAEAHAYAARFLANEDNGRFLVGGANYPTRPALVYAIETARLCCGTYDMAATALAVARLTVAELEPLTERTRT